MFTIFSRASRMSQQRRFAGLTVHMTFHVSMQLGLTYECFFGNSNKTVRFGLVFSNINCVVTGIGQCYIQNNTNHIVFSYLRAYSAHAASNSLFLHIVYECDITTYSCACWQIAINLLQSQYILWCLMKLWSLNLLIIACHYLISLLVTLLHMLI